jgi:predicted ATP-grasp superfamily ATP-dependent carboligase
MIKDKPLGTKIMETINKYTHQSVSNEEIEKEKQKLEQEIKDTSEESKREKTEILKTK